MVVNTIDRYPLLSMWHAFAGQVWLFNTWMCLALNDDNTSFPITSAVPVSWVFVS